jgi:hypothetical protein
MAVGLLMSSLALPVSAQPRDSAGADALFEAGREALERGDIAVACQRFEESNRLESVAGTILNLANCREKLGQLASAWQRYREAVQKLPPGDERLALARERAAALEPRVPRLTVVLASGAPADAKVYRGNVELGGASLGLPLPVDPGEHVITVSAPGRSESRVVVEIAEAEQRELTVEAGPADSAVGTSAADSSSTLGPVRDRKSDDGSGQRTAGFVIGGIGIAGLAVSLVAGAQALGEKNTVDDECDQNRCTQAGLDAADSGKTWVTVSNVAFAVGAVGVGVGAFLVLSAGSSRGSETAVGAHAVPGGGALRLQGHF